MLKSEELQNELDVLTTRRAEVAAEVATAAKELKETQSAFISLVKGRASAATVTIKQSAVTGLSGALALLDEQIATLTQQQAEAAAQEDRGQRVQAIAEQVAMVNELGGKLTAAYDEGLSAMAKFAREVIATKTPYAHSRLALHNAIVGLDGIDPTERGNRGLERLAADLATIGCPPALNIEMQEMLTRFDSFHLLPSGPLRPMFEQAVAMMRMADGGKA